ncbi:MAG: bifunctional riboflavin kinase/FAD synthetase [Aquificae bacterium]|nr:bifunctional riboflavin kinase/FAD synthetase [Aquificota bacterium]
MKVLTKEDIPLNQQVVCTIGNFDGFHKGHKQIINRLIQRSKQLKKPSLVITFEPHPKKVLDPENAPCRIINLETKMELLEKEGIDYLFIINFSPVFATLSPKEFIQFLCKGLGCSHLIVGHDWRFGYKGEGNTETAEQLGKEYGLTVEVVPPVLLGNERISSTKIRQLLKRGEVDKVSQYLGRPYYLKGKAVEGRKLGSKIGFPTVNILPPPDLCLKKGVYYGALGYGDTVYPSVINYGLRPTVDGKTAVIEAHIIDRQVDIKPSSWVKVYFKKFLRPEKKFESIDYLKKQIQSDVEEAKKLIGVEV